MKTWDEYKKFVFNVHNTIKRDLWIDALRSEATLTAFLGFMV